MVAQSVQLIGDRIEKLRATFGTQAAISRVRGSGGFSGGVDFFRGGLVKLMWQRLAGRGVDALQGLGAGGAALAADVVVAKNAGHEVLLKECRWCRVRMTLRQA